MLYFNSRYSNLFFDGENQEQEQEQQQEQEQEQQQEQEKKPEAKKPKLTVKLTPDQQSYVNSLLSEEKRKAQRSTEQLITNLETQKNLASTSQAEREALEGRIESLKAEYSTKEELQKKDTDKKIKELQAKVDASAKETTQWREKFIEDRIRSGIITSAVEHKAFDPEQIYAIVRPKTRLVDIIGEDNKPTGEYVPRAKIEGKGQDGVPTTLDLAISDAIKVMSEMPEKYGNLFNSGSNGGLGALSSSSRRGNVNGGPPEDPAAYMEWRKKRGMSSNSVR